MTEYCYIRFPKQTIGLPVMPFPITEPGLCAKLPPPEGYCWSDRDCKHLSGGRVHGRCRSDNQCTVIINENMKKRPCSCQTHYDCKASGCGDACFANFCMNIIINKKMLK